MYKLVIYLRGYLDSDVFYSKYRYNKNCSVYLNLLTSTRSIDFINLYIKT